MKHVRRQTAPSHAIVLVSNPEHSGPYLSSFVSVLFLVLLRRLLVSLCVDTLTMYGVLFFTLNRFNLDMEDMFGIEKFYNLVFSTNRQIMYKILFVFLVKYSPFADERFRDRSQ